MTKKSFLGKVNRSWYMRLFLFLRLPMAWFAGIGVTSCSEEECVVRLPYGWRSQNPFRSIYFAAQCAAAELSTGLLVLAQLQDRPPMSMLVTNISAEFHKKASAPLLFTCTDGAAIQAAVDAAFADSEARSFTATSIGRLPDGGVAAVVKITWSFKVKSR